MHEIRKQLQKSALLCWKKPGVFQYSQALKNYYHGADTNLSSTTQNT